MNIPFENPMLLVEETKLNPIGLVLVKARGGARPVPIQEDESRDSLVKEIVHIDGPSLFLTWWPAYGPPPVPGDWIDISANVVKADELQNVQENI